jgi:hypothetical protein
MKRNLKIGSTILIFLIVLSVPSYSGLRTGLKVQTVEMPGVSPTNTVAFAFERFALVAPYDPSGDPESIKDLDNNVLYIVDTKQPKDEPIKVSLGECYFPSLVLFDPESQRAFVRGTAFKEAEDGESISYEVIAHLRLQLQDDGKPVAASSAVMLPIPGRAGEETTPDAPGDMVLGAGGRYLLFTNGVRLFSYNLNEGYLYQFDIFSRDNYGPNSYVSFVGYDEATSTLVVSHNMVARDDAGNEKNRTALKFYTLEANGILPSLKFIEPDAFPEGTFLVPESLVAITADGDGLPESAYLVANDGGLYHVDLSRDPNGGDLFGGLRRMGHFPELEQLVGSGSPRIVKVDGSSRTVWAYGPGAVVVNIRRPVFSRPTRGSGIRRPVFVRSEEPPVLIAAQLNGKRTKLTNVTVLSALFAEDLSLSGLVIQEEGQSLVSTYTGRVFSIGYSEGSSDAQAELLGEIGSRVDYLTYNFEREKIVALSSAAQDQDENGETVQRPGGLVIATKREGKNSPVGLSITQMLSPFSPTVGAAVPSIRRPCNIGR